MNYTREQIKAIAKSFLGKTFGEINNQIEESGYNKGTYGHIIEQDGYDYSINSESRPDFEKAGIELKVTPYKKNKNGSLSAKERLVLNIINYMEEYKNDFYNSHFWYKNQLLEILWYLYEDNKDKKDLKITHELLYSIPEEDLPIIMSDWYEIIEKIKEGKAHEISEADTMYLGACTKGTNSNSLREQPFSDIPAKQRAFCFKTSYMTQLVRWYIGKENLEKIALMNPYNSTFEEELEEDLAKYHNQSVEELCNQFGFNTTAKNLNELLVTRMLGVKGKLSQTDQFRKANIVLKTIRVNQKGKIKESMSFPAFKFEDIINEEWENSELYEMFSTTKFMFAVFKEHNNQYYFDKIKFWNMPVNILNNDVKSVWQKTKDIVSSGNIVKSVSKNGARKTNFPGMSKNKYCHVRPHGKKSTDTYPLPVTDVLTGAEEYTKQCFWLNNNYVIEIIK